MSDFLVFKKAIQEQFTRMTQYNGVLFTTDVDKDAMWYKYLASFPEGTNPIYKTKSLHDCSCCRHFIRDIGDVVLIDPELNVRSIWDITTGNEAFDAVANEMSDYVKSKKIVDVFITREDKIGTDNNRALEDDKVKVYKHFFLKIPRAYIRTGDKSLDSLRGKYRDARNVFKRSMTELTVDAAKSILELIEQDSLYRGNEFKESVVEFIRLKQSFLRLTDEDDKDNWCWSNSFDSRISKIRNTSIGTLLVDLSEGVEIDEAVRKFEKVVAPENYHRPKAIVTKKMIEEAEKTITNLGYSDSLGRRHACAEDITVNNVLYVDRNTRKKMAGSVFDMMKDSLPENPKNFSKVEEIWIEDFISNVLPKTNKLELLLESRHRNNLMSLIAPVDKMAPTMLKWNNNFSWAYSGGTTDSMKERVKKAGGKVDGELRFSLQWNEDGKDHNDLDAHCILPRAVEHIHFAHKVCGTSGGRLDVDHMCPADVAVENITWATKHQMPGGEYHFFVKNYNHRGGMGGFRAELEFDGKIYSFDYTDNIKQGQEVTVAKVLYNKAKKEITILEMLPSNERVEETWGVSTNKFQKVSMCLLSPNHWDDQKGIGNKHYFFILEGCKNSDSPRGFFNEFLKGELLEHKRVFEALGSKMRVEYSDNQLSGVGFSDTKRDSIVVAVETNNIKRKLKINF